MKVAAAALGVFAVLGGAGVAIAIKRHDDGEVAAQHRRAAAAARARAVAAAQARRAKAQAQHETEEAVAQAQHEKEAREANEVAERTSLESQLESSLTKDATQKANEGLLTNGPALSTSCTPVSGGSAQNLSDSSGTYSCLAIYKESSEGTPGSGYSYSATINFAKGEYTWQLGPGEG